MSDKYETHYIELYDSTVLALIEAGLNPELLKDRYLAWLIPSPDDGKWIAVLKYDIGKDMAGPA